MKDASRMIPTRKSLLGRLRNWSDQESWKVFFDTYWRLIYNTASAAGLSDAEAQDVVQETVISVMKKMPEFEYDSEKGSFKGWLLNLTKWRIADQLRKRQRGLRFQSPDADHSPPGDFLEQVADPFAQTLEAAWDEEWEKNILDAALERVKRKVDSKHFQVFDLHACKHWTVSRVAQTLNINAGKVYLIKHRVGKLLKKEIEHLRAKPI